MDSNDEYFEKFIIKNIVDTVKYNPELDEYVINRIQISDELISKIVVEGLKYGLKPEEIRQKITLVANNMRTSPLVKVEYGNLVVDKIPLGQHIKIRIYNNVSGSQSLELINISKNMFYVLSSSIPGIFYRDELLSISKIWNNSYDIDFVMYRDKNRYPDVNSFLRIGKIICVEFFLPSLVHEILDSKRSFTFEENKKEVVAQNISIFPNVSDTNSYYVWVPKRNSPIAFGWSDLDNDCEAPFVITKENRREDAKIRVNKKFVFPQDLVKKQFMIDTLFLCCDVKGDVKNKNQLVDGLKYIKTLKFGLLRFDSKCTQDNLWILKEKPIIKFVYNE